MCQPWARQYSEFYREMQKKEDAPQSFSLWGLLYLLAQLFIYNKVEGGMNQVTRARASGACLCSWASPLKPCRLELLHVKDEQVRKSIL